MAFVVYYNVFPLRPSAFMGVPVGYRLFFMHKNWRLLEIIHLCYGLELDFVVDFPITYVLNIIALN